MDTNERIDDYQKAFGEFMAKDFESSVIASTKSIAAFDGGYCVELFPNGHYRVLWDGQIGNKYDSPGVIISIPALADDEWDEEDEKDSFFLNAEKEMKEMFSQWIEELQNL